MTTELKIHKHYIVRSIYKGKGYPDIFKMKVHEVTNKTYLISNLDATISNKQRFTIEDFNMNFSIVEELDIPVKGNSTDIDTLIMQAKSYGKNTSDNYSMHIAAQWSPFYGKDK